MAARPSVHNAPNKGAKRKICNAFLPKTVEVHLRFYLSIHGIEYDRRNITSLCSSDPH